MPDSHSGPALMKAIVKSFVRLCLPTCVFFAPLVWGQSADTSTLPTAPEAPVQRFEVGVQYAFLGKGVCYRSNCDVPPEIGVGPDFTWNITPHVAIDSAYNVLATDEHTPGFFNDGSVAGGRGASAVAGPRLEVRRQHYGLFIFGQMGAETWTRAPNPYIVSNNNGTLTVLSPPDGSRAFFSVAAGAGAEYSPTPRLHFRIAVSQRYVDYGQRYLGSFCSTCGVSPTAWDVGDDLTAGLYVGVGPSLRKRGPYLEEVHPHRFFDKWNILLITGASLATIGDGVTTQLFLDKGLPEGNPIERTFVQRGVGGDIALGAIAGVAVVGAMYGLHRMGHHIIERFIPAAILVLGARNTYLNSKVD